MFVGVQHNDCYYCISHNVCSAAACGGISSLLCQPGVLDFRGDEHLAPMLDRARTLPLTTDAGNPAFDAASFHARIKEFQIREAAAQAAEARAQAKLDAIATAQSVYDQSFSEIASREARIVSDAAANAQQAQLLASHEALLESEQAAFTLAKAEFTEASIATQQQLSEARYTLGIQADTIREAHARIEASLRAREGVLIKGWQALEEAQALLAVLTARIGEHLATGSSIK